MSAPSLNNLAELYRDQGRYAEAEPLYKRALAIREKALGPDHPDVGTSLNNLAELYRAQGRYAEAEPLYKRALAIREKALGPDHPDVGTALNNLAELYRAQGRYAEAEPLFKRALAIREKALGPDHPDVGTSLNNLAVLYFVQRDWARAADFWRRSTGVIVRRAQRGTDDVGQALTGKRKGEAEQIELSISGGLSRWCIASRRKGAARTQAWRARCSRPRSGRRPRRRPPRWRRWPRAGPRAIRRWRHWCASARTWSAEWQKRDRRAQRCRSRRHRTSAIAQPRRPTSARLAAIDARIAEIDKTAGERLPRLCGARQSGSRSASSEVQAQLARRRGARAVPRHAGVEADAGGDLHLGRHQDGHALGASELGTPALTREVAALRCGLDHTLWEARREREQVRRRCCKASPTAERGRRPGRATCCPSMLARAHELYKALLGPAEDLIKGKHLLIVPSGPLTSLPFNVLVTEPPKAAMPGKLAELSRRRLARHAPAHHRAALGRLAQGAAPVRQGEPCHQALPRHRQSAARRAAAGPQVGRALQGAGRRGPRAAAMSQGGGPAPRAGGGPAARAGGQAVPWPQCRHRGSPAVLAAARDRRRAVRGRPPARRRRRARSCSAPARPRRR